MMINEILTDAGLTTPAVLAENGTVIVPEIIPSVDVLAAINKLRGVFPAADEQGAVWWFDGNSFGLRPDCDTDENHQQIRDAVIWATGDGAALEVAKAVKIAELRQGWTSLEKEPLLTTPGVTVLVEPIDIFRWQQLHSFVSINHTTYPEGHEKRQEIFEVKDAFGHWHSLTTAELLPLLDEIASYYQTSVYGRFAAKEAMVRAADSVDQVEGIYF